MLSCLVIDITFYLINENVILTFSLFKVFSTRVEFVLKQLEEKMYYPFCFFTGIMTHDMLSMCSFAESPCKQSLCHFLFECPRL